MQFWQVPGTKLRWLQPCWDQVPSCTGGFTVNTKMWPHTDGLLLAIFNFYYENMRRQNKGLSNVNQWLSSSWLALLSLALSVPQSVPNVAHSQPLPFPTAHPPPPHHSPGGSLHPTRLKSLIKSTSPRSPPVSDELSGSGKWQHSQGKAAAFRSCFYFVWSRSKPEEDLNSDLLGPRAPWGYQLTWDSVTVPPALPPTPSAIRL